MSNDAAPAHDERLYSVREAATDPASPLGGRIGEATLYKFIRAGKVPGVVRVGRLVYVTVAGMREFIAKGGAR